MTIKAAPRLAPTTKATLWRFVPESDSAVKIRKSRKNAYVILPLKFQIHKRENIMRKKPFNTSGGKDRGSGMTAEQLFPAFGPQIKGLPTILQVKKKDEEYFRN